ncbi:isocitrate lyase/PEP mutase family protein [Actinomadura luteofluorescens]|uniref:isocitrate lyase/PEP mutase family protein n=1 Tax=Actinomadura luteofluorescens TaxID=46163 RepID=UPI0021642484|nr:isocitrate lyase/PEP mutase family protein [Actinomadura glauciflava]MCR3740776.1 methylisocitrate lyase [Actinomadura glauciflava]
MRRHPGFAADRLRARIATGPPLLAAGCHDALSARLATEAGFEAVHLSGAMVSATALGLPDLGFAGATDMVEALRRVAAGTGLPIVADADTGYGDVLQAAETARRYEAAGAAALHLEDQVLPKRCGHMEGRRLVPAGEAAARVAAAAGARERLLVIARTDALSVAGLPETLRRVAAYAAAGADAVFVEGCRRAADFAEVRQAARGLPLVASYSEAGPPPEPLAALAKEGVRLALFPVGAALAGARAMRDAYRHIAATGAPPDGTLPWADFTGALGLEALTEDERRHRPSTDAPQEPA